MRVFLIIGLLQFFLAPCFAQQGTVIYLSDTKAAYTPGNFHIVAVQDKRTNNTQLGRLNDGPINLQGGVANALMEYINKNVTQDKSTIPVILQLDRFDITEKAVGRKRQFDLNVTLSYYTGASKLVEYSGSAFAQSMGEAQGYIDKLIRDNIINNFREFDKWMAVNKATISAKPAIEIELVMTNTSTNTDRIPYTASRKLTIKDFKATPDEASPGAAATMSGVGMEIAASSFRNTTKVKVTLSVYFDKSRSWMKDNGKNPQVLAHEQLHFDITAIKACELKKQIEEASFTPQHYREELRAMLKKNEDEGTEMQNVYDRETNHGTIATEQQRWSELIAEMMSKQKCY